MPETIYLFGAGASCQHLPLGVNISAKIQELINILSKVEIVSSANTKRILAFRNKLIDDFNWLITGAEKFGSVDTYAKKLGICKEIEQLYRLKLALSWFFVLYESVCKVDQRYDKFFASILDIDGGLPSDISILTWNYDTQIERAYAKFKDIKTLVQCKRDLNVTTSDSLFSSTEAIRKDGFFVHKLLVS